MKLMNGNIDRLFRGKLSDLSIAPSDEVWDRIEGDLMQKKKKPVIAPWFYRVAAAVIIMLGISGLVYKFMNRNSDTLTVPQNINAEAVVDEKNEDHTLQKDHSRIKENRPYIALSDNKTEGKSNREKEDLSLTTSGRPFAFSTNDPAATRQTDNLDYQTPREPDIENHLLAYESDHNLMDGNNANAIPVNHSVRTNSYSSLYDTEETPQKDRSLRWSVGGQAGPQYTYREVVVENQLSQNIDLDDYESGVVTYAGGFNVQLETKSRFSVQSGVYYSKIGTNKAEIIYASRTLNAYSNDDIFDQEPVDIANSTGSFTFDKQYTTPEPEPAQTIEQEYVKGQNVLVEYFEYIEVPFIVSYKIIDRKLGVDLNGGLWTNFLIGMDATSTTSEPIEITQNPENINNINYSGSVGVGFDYPITSGILFNLEPVFKYYFSPINKTETKVHPYSFGIMTGIRYSF
jgi:hypothetical protein